MGTYIQSLASEPSGTGLCTGSLIRGNKSNNLHKHKSKSYNWIPEFWRPKGLQESLWKHGVNLLGRSETSRTETKHKVYPSLTSVTLCSFIQSPVYLNRILILVLNLSLARKSHQNAYRWQPTTGWGCTVYISIISILIIFCERAEEQRMFTVVVAVNLWKSLLYVFIFNRTNFV